MRVADNALEASSLGPSKEVHQLLWKSIHRYQIQLRKMACVFIFTEIQKTRLYVNGLFKDSLSTIWIFIDPVAVSTGKKGHLLRSHAVLCSCYTCTSPQLLSTALSVCLRSDLRTSVTADYGTLINLHTYCTKHLASRHRESQLLTCSGISFVF